jgi:ABC-type Fe3+ transport system permease subunit
VAGLADVSPEASNSLPLAVAMLWTYLNPPSVLYGTLWTLLIAYVTHYLPYGVRTITSIFRQISIEFERAALLAISLIVVILVRRLSGRTNVKNH